MNEQYEEIVAGETLLRHAPDSRHEAICARLHARVGAALEGASASRLLPPRSVVRLAPGTMVRPDLALVTAATGKIWLAAEIVNSKDHRFDTVQKKFLYEEFGLPRLWMVDPRYDNLEIYHGGPYGLALMKILAQHEVLTEKLLPEFTLTMAHLFDLTPR